MKKRIEVMCIVAAICLIAGCATGIPARTELMRKAEMHGGKATLVSYDPKTKTARVDSYVKKGDMLHDGIYHETYWFNGKQWECIESGPIR